MLEDLIKERKKKVKELREQGINPYPIFSQRTASIKEALDSFSAWSKSRKKIYLVGRIRSLRDQGKIVFLDLEDMSEKIQVVFKKEETQNFSFFKKYLDIGDFLEVYGYLFKTQRGEKSILALRLKILAKSLRPLPSDFYGLVDTETRLRKRYLDLILNKETKELFIKKSKFWKAVREFLDKEGFLEVETPVFEMIPGGAEAEPFVTHHNALDQDFYLRISLEIALKKLIVGGFEKIYEIGRVFRNEGIDAEHLQDYTQMEFYWAYADYRQLMTFLKKMYRFVIKKTFGTLVFKWQGKKIDWGKEWKVYDYCKLFFKENKIDPKTASLEELLKKAQSLQIEVPQGAGKGRLIDLIYKKTVRPKLIQPCFLINPPVEIEPLAKRSEKDPRVVERLQVMAYGTELGKGFSELNDPQDQRERFEEQMKLRAAGDKEAQMLDEDFLEALEYGMPPTAGFGMSERLFAVLANKPIRETIFFPPMKKKS
ncbi:MAG: lysine--tRNA ligase [Patescibacteria group bacterium]|nr:lysine--tRNA ligase [Patescibacteria group bacterium]